MKRYTGSFLVVVLTSFIILAGCANSDRQTSAEGAVGTEAVYLDVRTPEEIAQGYVQGSVQIPYDRLSERWEELASYKDRPIKIYCRSGRRASVADSILRAHGFTRVENAGGFDALKAAGVPVVLPDSTVQPR